MKRSIFAILIFCCVLGLADLSFSQSCSFSPELSSYPVVSVSSYSCPSEALAACQNTYGCSSCQFYTDSNGNYPEYQHFITSSVPWSIAHFLICGNLSNCPSAVCNGCVTESCSIDSDGDGIPDDREDSDGDGIPDGQDPCPQNPNPDCTDPDNPPPDPPENPEIPGEIETGDCIVDLTKIKSLFSADGGKFPFNWITAFNNVLNPFFYIRGSKAPDIKYTFNFFGQSKEIDLNLQRFDRLATVFRFFSGLLMIFYFVQFVNRLYSKVISGGK